LVTDSGGESLPTDAQRLLICVYDAQGEVVECEEADLPRVLAFWQTVRAGVGLSGERHG
jgi:hypothetical protein